MDDTLYDEIDYYQSGMAAVAEVIAKDKVISSEKAFDVLWRIFSSGNHHTTFNAALDELGIGYDKNYITRLVTALRAHKPKITLPRESREVLEKLKDNYKLALITDGFLPGQREKIAALGIEEFFDSIVCTEEMGREFWKPSKAGFEKMLKDLDLKPADCVYVGDNLEKDFLAPNKLGFKTVRIVRPRHIHLGDAPEKLAEPDCEINSISALPELLEKISYV